ncbi:hypothetical protein MRB53_040444 [Persea americana]|nr:hypothetical protein MRB53_040444 [Persea americana]
MLNGVHQDDELSSSDLIAGDECESELTDLEDIEHAMQLLEDEDDSSVETHLDRAKDPRRRRSVRLSAVSLRKQEVRAQTPESSSDDSEFTLPESLSRTNRSARERPQKSTPFDKLPNEVFVLIAGFLAPPALWSLTQVCRAFRNALDCRFLVSYSKLNMAGMYESAIQSIDDASHYRRLYVDRFDDDEYGICEFCGVRHEDGSTDEWLPSLDPRDSAQIKQWFAYKMRRFCVECGIESFRVFKPTGETVCDRCQALPQYALINVTRAKREYLLTDRDMAIEDTAIDKHGSLHDLEVEKKQRENAAESRRKEKIASERQRAQDLENALLAVGLSLRAATMCGIRSKSRTAQLYIKKGQGDLRAVVKLLREGHLLVNHTNFGKLLKATEQDLHDQLATIELLGPNGRANRIKVRDTHHDRMRRRALRLLEAFEKKHLKVPLKKVTVVEEYDGPHQGDLFLEPGEVVRNVSLTEIDGIFYGTNKDGDSGTFPVEYVKERERDPMIISMRIKGQKQDVRAHYCSCGHYDFREYIKVKPCKPCLFCTADM